MNTLHSTQANAKCVLMLTGIDRWSRRGTPIFFNHPHSPRFLSEAFIDKGTQCLSWREETVNAQLHLLDGLIPLPDLFRDHQNHMQGK